MNGTFTPATPFTTIRPDKGGILWLFAYWGSGYVYIREMLEDEDHITPIGENASRDDWPFLIDLNYYGMIPEDVTAYWLLERVTDWITDYNTDIDLGNV